LSTRAYPDQIWHGLRWTWELQRSKHDMELLATVDATITSAFGDENYLPRSGDEYIALIRSHYTSLPDMTHSFFGPAGAFATCFDCERESRGLHLHASPQDKSEASRLLSQVEHKASNSALKVAVLRKVISELTYNHKLTIVSVIFTLLGAIVTLMTRFPLGGILADSVRVALGIAVTLSLVYIIVVLLLMIAREYYASRLVWRF